MKKYHLAVNFVPEKGVHVLCRIKEMPGAPTLLLSKALLPQAVKHESFVAEIDGLLPDRGYLYPRGTPRIVCRESDRPEMSNEEFDYEAYLKSLTEDEKPW